MRIGGQMHNEEILMNRALMKDISAKKRILEKKRIEEEMHRKRDQNTIIQNSQIDYSAFKSLKEKYI